MSSYRLVFPVVNNDDFTCFGVNIYNRNVCDDSALWNSIDINNNEKQLDYSIRGLSGAPSGELIFNQLFIQQSTKVKSPHLQITFNQIDNDNSSFTTDIFSDCKKYTRLNFTCESAGLALYLASKAEFPKERFYFKTLIVSCAVNFLGGDVSAVSLINGDEDVYQDFLLKLKYISKYKKNHLENAPIVILHKDDIREIGIEKIESITSLKVCPLDKDSFSSKDNFEKHNKAYSIFGIDSNSVERLFSALDLIDPFTDFSNLNYLEDNLLPSAKLKIFPSNTYLYDLFRRKYPNIPEFELTFPEFMEEKIKDYSKSEELVSNKKFQKEAMVFTLKKLFRINQTSLVADKYNILDTQDKITIVCSYLIRENDYTQKDLRNIYVEWHNFLNKHGTNKFNSKKKCHPLLNKNPDCFSVVGNSKLETKENLKIITSLLENSIYKNRYLVFQCQGQNWDADESSQTITVYNEYKYDFSYNGRKVSFTEALQELGQKFDNSVDYLLVVYPNKNLITAIYLGKNLTSNLKIGDYCHFGNYLQNFSSISPEQKTRIKWIVIDIQGNNALLLSSQCLFRWDFSSNCSDYLNNIFYSDAFSEIEKKRIKQKRASKIFLLSRKDLSKGYLSREKNRISYESEYSFINDECVPVVGISRDINWLLEKDTNSSEYFYLNLKGQICSSSRFTENIGVRPALWVEIADSSYSDLGEQSLEFIKNSIKEERSFLIKYNQINPNKEIWLKLWLKLFAPEIKEKILQEKTLLGQILNKDITSLINNEITDSDIITDQFNVDSCAQFLHSLITNEIKDPINNHMVFTINESSIKLNCNDFFDCNLKYYNSFLSFPDEVKDVPISNLDLESKVSAVVLNEELAKYIADKRCKFDEILKNVHKTINSIKKILDDYKIPKEVEWIVIPSKKDLSKPFGNCVYAINLKQIHMR